MVPSKKQIEDDRKRLQEDLINFNPEVVVTIGKLSLSYCLQRKLDKLDGYYIGRSFRIDPYGLLGKEILVIPFPHSSGASTWKYKKGNKELLEKALKLFKDNLY